MNCLPRLLIRCLCLLLPLAALDGCILFKPQNRLFQPEVPLPPEASTGEQVAAFRQAKANKDPRSLTDSLGDLLIPQGGEALAWFPVSDDWNVERNELDVVLSRYATSVIAYRLEGKCFWTEQNYLQEHQGGGRYGRTRLVEMSAAGRAINQYPCPESAPLAAAAPAPVDPQAASPGAMAGVFQSEREPVPFELTREGSLTLGGKRVGSFTGGEVLDAHGKRVLTLQGDAVEVEAFRKSKGKVSFVGDDLEIRAATGRIERLRFDGADVFFGPDRLASISTPVKAPRTALVVVLALVHLGAR